MLRFLHFAHRYQAWVDKLFLPAYSEKIKRVTFTQHSYLSMILRTAEIFRGRGTLVEEKTLRC